MSATTLTQMSQPKPRRGRPNKYKGESEFYATVIPKGMKAEADEVIENAFGKFQTDEYNQWKERKKKDAELFKKQFEAVGFYHHKKAKQSKPEQDEQS